jgi:hypothetical protein
VKRLSIAVLAAGLMAGAGSWLSAQPQSTTVNVTATPATMVTTAVAAGTMTLTPTTVGQSVYLQEIDIQNCAGASAVTAAAVTTITSTNIAGGLAFTVGSGVAAGLCQPTQTIIYPDGLKAQTPTLPVTFVVPTFATNQTLRVNVAWRSAP